jgi:hypothetical protein
VELLQAKKDGLNSPSNITKRIKLTQAVSKGGERNDLA